MKAPRMTLRERTRELAASGRLLAFGVAALYSFLLWFDYKTFISPAFTYLSFVYFRHSGPAVALDVAMAAAPTLFLSLAARRPSDLALMLLYVLVYIPSVLFTTTVVTIVTPEIMIMKLTMLGSLWLMKWIAGNAKPRGKFYLFEFKHQSFMLGIAGLTVICIGVIGVTFGFRLALHNFKDVYTQRAAFEDQLQGAGWNQYLVGLTNNVLGPMLFAYGLFFRKPLFLALGAFTALYVFSITGLKNSILALVYVGLLFAGSRWFSKSFLLRFLIGAIVLVLIGMATASPIGQDPINSLLVRRTLMIQGVLMAYYHDYFSQAPYLYLSTSILAPFFGGKGVALNPDELIGQQYFHADEHANASIWADGFANGGEVGMVLSAIAVALFLRAINYSTSRSDPKFAICATSMIFFILSQTGLVKVLGTHGGLIACLLFLVADIRRAAPGIRRDVLGRALNRREKMLEPRDPARPPEPQQI